MRCCGVFEVIEGGAHSVDFPHEPPNISAQGSNQRNCTGSGARKGRTKGEPY